LQVVDKESDLEHEDVSLSIRRGTGGWKGYASSCIAEEEIIPVASASYVDRYGKPDTIEELARNQFNHLEEPYRPRPKWRDWIATFDFDYIDNGEGLRLNDYALVVQAAMSGEGIAIGWKHIVALLISSGLLVQVMPLCWKSGEEFHLIWSSRTTLSPHAEQVRDWIINEARSTGELNRASPSSYLA
jgi:DNA-binding transcriptional LysR family regulator